MLSVHSINMTNITKLFSWPLWGLDNVQDNSALGITINRRHGFSFGSVLQKVFSFTSKDTISHLWIPAAFEVRTSYHSIVFVSVNLTVNFLKEMDSTVLRLESQRLEGLGSFPYSQTSYPMQHLPLLKRPWNRSYLTLCFKKSELAEQGNTRGRQQNVQRQHHGLDSVYTQFNVTVGQTETQVSVSRERSRQKRMCWEFGRESGDWSTRIR